MFRQRAASGHFYEVGRKTIKFISEISDEIGRVLSSAEHLLAFAQTPEVV